MATEVTGSSRHRTGPARACPSTFKEPVSSGRPRTFDAHAYKGRNVVEPCKLKQSRGDATRFDKTARSYLAGLTLAAIPICKR